MPNFCKNNLQITGSTIQLSEFLNRSMILHTVNGIDTIQLTFEALLPTPDELIKQPALFRGENSEDLIEKYGYADWYSWRTNNWGTKWDAAHTTFIKKSDTEALIEFETAWSPPVNWLQNIAPQFPELRFKLVYSEPGFKFCGMATWDAENGFDDEESDLEWQDQYGNLVEYDFNELVWKISETGEVIDETEFYPIEYNPYLNKL